MLKILRNIYFIILLLILFPVSAAAKDIKISIIPFKINSSENLDYLKDAVYSMLLTRLSQNDIEIVESEKINENLSDKELFFSGAEEKIDYIIMGSLNKIGSKISIDVKILNIKEGGLIKGLYIEGNSLDKLIPLIGQLSKNISDIFHGKVSKPKIKDEFLSNLKRPKINTLNIYKPFWESKSISGEIKNIDIGDMDGDGKEELVLISDNRLMICKIKGKKIKVIKRYKGNKGNQFLRVDLFDINRDKKDEIYVTNWDYDKLKSFVIEYRDNEFKIISKNLKWFLRVIRLPGEGKVLIGEEYNKKDIFKEGIKRILLKNGKYQEGKSIDIPIKDINIYSFDIGEYGILVIDNKDNLLKLFSKKGNVLWISEEIYNISGNLIDKYPKEDILGYDKTSKIPIPSRIIDRGRDIILFKNRGEYLDLFSPFSKGVPLRDGEIDAFLWNGSSFTINWKSKPVDGYISDIQIGDINSDGRKELIVVICRKKGLIFKKIKSNILLYKLPEKS
jgi:TolB-like protein